jgi:hypothetical protein
MALASLLDHDASSAAAALAGMETTGSHGTVVKLAKRYTEAGIAALEGRSDEALGALLGVIDGYRELELPFAVATTRLTMASLLDGSIPEVAAATVEARAIFERLGARAWVDRLDEAVSGSGAPGSASDAPSDRVASPQ